MVQYLSYHWNSRSSLLPVSRSVGADYYLNSLQQSFLSVQQAFSALNFVLNTSKTNVMWFGKKKAPLPTGVITTSKGLELEVVTSYKMFFTIRPADLPPIFLIGHITAYSILLCKLVISVYLSQNPVVDTYL